MKNTKDIQRIFGANIQNNVIMNWKFLNQPLGKCDLSGGYAPEKKNWIPVAMAAASALSSIFGGISSSKANREAQKQVAAQKAATQAERRRRYYENPLDRGDVQNLIRVAKQQSDRIYKKAEGAAAVTGATDASTQMAKDAGNNMMAETVANIAADDASRKDEVDAQLRREENQLTQQQIALKQQQGQNIASAAGQAVSSLAQGAISLFGAGSPGGAGVTAPASQSGALQTMATAPKVSIPTLGNAMFEHGFGRIAIPNNSYLNIAMNAARGINWGNIGNFS